MRLNLHGLLGTHENPLAVHVRAEGYALLGDLAELGKGEYLKSARVGKHGTGPIEELMETAHAVNKVVTRSDVKMICVGKLYLTVDLLKVTGGNTALDCGGCAYVHKYGSLDGAVYGFKAAAASLSFLLK